MYRTTKHLAFFLTILLCVSGCSSHKSGGGDVAGLNTFVASNAANGGGANQIDASDSDIPEILDELAGGNTVRVESILEGDETGSDAALARSERGRIAQIQGEPKKSLPEFKAAVDKIKEFEERARISASDVGSHAAALVVNDNVIPYEPAGFERVLVYHFQAMNYLMEGNLEGAGVEVRRANAEQERALKEHEAELAEAEKDASEKGFKPSDFMAGINQELGDSKAVAALVKNSFQNAYTFYMSGVVHELMNEQNDAYIDYKKALEIAPANEVIQKDVARLAKALSMGDDITRYSKSFPRVFAAATGRDSSKSEVIVLFEDGLVPEKTSLSFPIPIPIPKAPGLTSISIPILRASVAPVQPLVLKVDGGDVGRTERICAIDALAVKAYEESAPAMITRQVLRAAIKGAASSLASEYGGGWAGAAVSMYNVLTENADLRSWRSLPQNAQVLRAEVDPGSTLQLLHDGTGASGSLTIPKEAGKRVIVRATRVGSRLFIQNVTV